MVRRSTRNKVSAHQDEQANFSKGNVAQDENVAGVQPPQKRAKKIAGVQKPKAKPAKNKGSLALLVQMPLDIIYEILGHLRPLDLLRVSRICKLFHKTLMNRTARPIWIASLSAIPGLPSCPKDMTEPQFVRLAFDARCSNCSATNVHAVKWELRVRGCKSCLRDKSWIMSAEEAYSSHPELSDEMICCTPRSVLPGSRKIKDVVCLTSDVARVYEALIARRDDNRTLKAFVEEQTVHVDGLCAEALVFHEWHETWRDEHAFELDKIRIRRRRTIYQHLRDLGWGSYMDMMTAKGDMAYHRQWMKLREHTLVRQPKALTPRSWSNIKPTLLALMADFKKESQPIELCDARTNRSSRITDVLSAYAQTQPLEEVLPNIQDLYQMDVFDHILNWPVEDADKDDIPDRLFEDLASRLPALTEQWRRSLTSTLLGRLTASSPLPTNPMATNAVHEEGNGQVDSSRLELAATLFSCTVCKAHHRLHLSAPLTYKNAMAHTCDGPPRLLIDHRVGGGGKLVKSPARLELNHISYDARYAECARVVIKACGLDPASATTAQMDALDGRLACTDCDRHLGKCLAMDWRNAVIHCSYAPNGVSSRPRLLRLNSTDEAVVKAQEKDPTPLNSGEGAEYCWVCVRCRLAERPPYLEHHLRSEHRVSTVEPGDCRLGLGHFAIPPPYRNVYAPLKL